jgi:DNA-binding transcriptional MerR regulator
MKNPIPKLPGYEKSQELIKLLRNKGFSDKEISQKLLNLEREILAEIVLEIEGKMSPQRRSAFDQYLKVYRTPEEVKNYLKLDQAVVSAALNEKLQKVIEKLQN